MLRSNMLIYWTNMANISDKYSPKLNKWGNRKDKHSHFLNNYSQIKSY